MAQPAQSLRSRGAVRCVLAGYPWYGHHSMRIRWPAQPRSLPAPSGLADRDGAPGAAALDAITPYQPKPAPTPIELSSPLSAPPTVTVARGLIARW
nr:hypothetical protein XAC3615_10400002 [Xanthomonas citri pv. citri]